MFFIVRAVGNGWGNTNPQHYHRDHASLTLASTSKPDTSLLGRYIRKVSDVPARSVQRNPRQPRAQLGISAGSPPWTPCRGSSNPPANASLCGSSGGARIARGFDRMLPLVFRGLYADAFFHAERGPKPHFLVGRQKFCQRVTGGDRQGTGCIY